MTYPSTYRRPTLELTCAQYNCISLRYDHHLPPNKHTRKLHDMASNYTQPPPAYPSNNKLASVAPDEEASQPLLHPQAGPSAGLGGYYDEPMVGDVPDDFKVSGVLSKVDVPDAWLASTEPA